MATPGKGKWEAGMFGKGADSEQDSQSPTVTGKQLFFVQQRGIMSRSCSIPASGSMAGLRLS